MACRTTIQRVKVLPALACPECRAGRERARGRGLRAQSPPKSQISPFGSACRRPPDWFVELLARILTGSPSVRGLFSHWGPFSPERPPRQIRARMIEYVRVRVGVRGADESAPVCQPPQDAIPLPICVCFASALFCMPQTRSFTPCTSILSPPQVRFLKTSMGPRRGVREARGQPQRLVGARQDRRLLWATGQGEGELTKCSRFAIKVRCSPHWSSFIMYMPCPKSGLVVVMVYALAPPGRKRELAGVYTETLCRPATSAIC